MHPLAKNDPQPETHELAEPLGVSQPPVLELLSALRIVSKVWMQVPHQVTKTHRHHRVEAVILLVLFRRIKTGLNSIVTVDGKLVL